ncbi:regulatory protein, luxR family [Paractinoplanes atraurantiacus]|uniref:Regulatory protein, luxR family n=2 Tax=Paractinoplanes atraurantiacus TaxID=1036182 RepID=A0A285F611_9ACTN|nr:regulatory protein, luxR family [Actinoplanes atraurantiacus]
MLRDLLDRAKKGRGGALVIRGEAGIGKTALLQAVEAEAGGMRVLRATGVESESRLPYAALHQLLFPLTAQINFESDLYAVARAVLELIADAAPVVLVLDDLHWFDKESGDVLAFVARRIGSEAVLAVGATRLLSRESGLPDLEIGRLPGDVAAALLDAHAPDLPAVARRRLLTEAAGNPLALVELPKTAAGRLLDETLPLNSRLERAFAARAEDTGTAGLLLVLAADTNCDLKRLLAAAGAGLDDVQRAIDAELIVLDGASLRFRHPLMRSAVYQRAPLAARLAAHRALAEQLADFPDRRLWHLASAAVGTDEGLAAELELYAERARARGATMAAVAALRRAGELTDRPGRLTLRAAELASEVGARHEVEQMLAGNDLGGAGPVERARLANVLEVVRYPRYTDPLRRVRELTDIAEAAIEAGSPEVGRQVLWRAASRCFFQTTGPETAGARARIASLVQDDPLSLAILAYTVPEERGREVLQKISDYDDPEAARWLGSAALVLGDFERSSSMIGEAVDSARSQGRLGVLARLLGGSNWGRLWLGQWDRAHAELTEARGLAQETGEAFYAMAAQTSIAAITAMRGDLDRATELLEEVEASPLTAGMRYIQVALAQARGLVHLFRGEAGLAYAVLARTFDPAEPTYHRYMRWWLVPDLLDAAIGAGRLDEAREVIAELPELAERVGAPILVVAAEYASVLTHPDTGEITTRWPLYRARLQLHRGRKGRRNKDLLRSARDTFDMLGATPWADMARAELHAAGEHSGQRREAVREKLSPQELQIAAMAAEGLTNREIAERLFLSHRTIGSHLYRIYPKLGISRRAQLSGVLGVT